MASRWYPESLAERILSIAALRERIVFTEGDGLDLIAGLTDVVHDSRGYAARGDEGEGVLGAIGVLERSCHRPGAGPRAALG